MTKYKLTAMFLAAATIASISAIAAAKKPAGALPKTAYLFSYFINNGEDGLHLAWSTDGLNWNALNGGKSYILSTGHRQLTDVSKRLKMAATATIAPTIPPPKISRHIRP